MLHITPIQEQALYKLSEYKFLTISQLADLLGSSPNWTRTQINKLIEIGVLGSTNYGVIPQKGLLEKVYYLTPKGAKILSEDLGVEKEKIRYPIGEVTFRHDYFHRFWTVNVHIALNKFIEANHGQLFTLLTYYDKVGSQRKEGMTVATRLDFEDEEKKKVHINPDMLAGYFINSKPYLFAIEIYNGKDTKRVIEQVKKVFIAIYEGATIPKFPEKKSCRLLLVFEHESILQATLQRIKTILSDFEDPESVIFANTSEGIKKDFGTNWIDLSGKKIDFKYL